MQRAVILVPSEDRAHRKWLTVCGDFCSRHKVLITAVARNYVDALSMLVCGGADIIVVARRDHLPPDPIRVVAEECATGGMADADSRPDPPESLARPHRRWGVRTPPR